MSSLFEPRPQSETWLQIGRLQVTSTLAVVLLGAIGSLAWVIVPSLPASLALIPERLLAGELWRLFSWPLAGSVDLWQLLMLVMLWFFGTQLENSIGRNKMAQLYLGCWAVLTLTTAVIGLLLPASTVLLGLRTVEFCILLLFIAENPNQLFFFRIPAWVFGAVFLGLEILQLLGFRMGGTLLALLLSLLGVALIARGIGLLSAYNWLPGSNQSGGAINYRKTSPRPAAASRAERRQANDEQRLDDLLSKISSQGIHSLTKSERAELDKIRERRRRG